MRSLVLSRHPLSSVTTEQSASFSPSLEVSLGFRLCLRRCCCRCGGGCADSCRTGCSAHKPSLQVWCFQVWQRHGSLHIRRCRITTAFTSIGCFGPPLPS